MKAILLTSLLFAGANCYAAPVSFKNCQSPIETEVFIPCSGQGEDPSEPCDSKKTLHGQVSADMTIDSQAKSAQADIRFTDLKGVVQVMPTTCALDRFHWMNCETSQKVEQLGRLTISFNISGVAPDVYFAQIFAESENAPVGGFQNTDDVCEK